MAKAPQKYFHEKLHRVETTNSFPCESLLVYGKYIATCYDNNLLSVYPSIKIDQT